MLPPARLQVDAANPKGIHGYICLARRGHRIWLHTLQNLQVIAYLSRTLECASYGFALSSA